MNREFKGSYRKEFRDQAVKLVLEEGQSQRQAAEARYRTGSGAGAGQARTGGDDDGARCIKKSDGLFCEEVAVKYDRIEVMRQDYPVTRLCRVFEVGASGYYA